MSDKVQFWVGGELVGPHDTKSTPVDTNAADLRQAREELTKLTGEHGTLKTQLQAVIDERDGFRLDATKLMAELAHTKTQLAAAQKQASDAVQDAALAPYSKGGGHYEFPAEAEGGEPLKVRGQAKAWEHFQTLKQQ